MIFFAYIRLRSRLGCGARGKESANVIADRNLGSLFICTVLLHFLMAVVLTGITDWRTSDVPNPVSFAHFEDRASCNGWCGR